MLVLARAETREADARLRLESVLSGSAALAKFRQMVTAQGGDPRVVDDPGRLPQAKRKVAVRAGTAGWVRAIDAAAVGEIAHGLTREGGPGAGVMLLKKRGDKVADGEPVAVVHGGAGAQQAARALADAFDIGARAPRRRPLVLEAVASGSAP